MKKLALILSLTFMPAVAFAGSATYTTPGTYSFTVPAYGSMTVTVTGSGGGGGGSAGYGGSGNAGGAGGTISFGSITAYGGSGGQGGQSSTQDTYGWTTVAANGAFVYLAPGANGGSGGASGGDSNVSGGGASGGAGGAPNASFGYGQGGSGGTGGRAARSYSYGQLTPGSTIQVSISTGGTGYSNNYSSNTATGSGGAGGVRGLGGGASDGTIDYPGNNGAYGGNGSVSISWTAEPAASCSVSFDQNPIAYGGGTYLHWSSIYADSYVYINNVGYVGSSGSAYVGPLSNTDYSCIASGNGGTDGWHSAILYVNAPASCSLPWGGSIAHGQSVTAYQAQYASPCASQARTCNNGSLSGSYPYSSCQSSTCTLDGVTVNNGQSYTFYSTTAAPQGQFCSSYSQSRTCTNGTFSGSSSYSHASCSCTAQYSCSGSTVMHTDASCNVTTVTSCQSPAFCSAGSSSCLYPSPSFTAGNGTTGHLQILPSLVLSGSTAKIYWDVANVSTCSVTGTNGDSWSGSAAGCTGSECTSSASGKLSSLLTQQATYTLTCAGLDTTHVQESATVNVIPIFHEF